MQRTHTPGTPALTSRATGRVGASFAIQGTRRRWGTCGRWWRWVCVYVCIIMYMCGWVVVYVYVYFYILSMCIHPLMCTYTLSPSDQSIRPPPTHTHLQHIDCLRLSVRKGGGWTAFWGTPRGRTSYCGTPRNMGMYPRCVCV